MTDFRFPKPEAPPRVTQVLVVRKPRPIRTFWDRLFRRPGKAPADRRRMALVNNAGTLIVPEEMLEFVEQAEPDPAEERRYTGWRDEVMNRHAFDRHRP